MSPEEKIAAAEKLIAEAKAELAAKKRNWPEKIEPGMLFRYLDKVWIAMSATGRHPCDTLVSLESGFTYALHNLFNGRDQLFVYLGHARDLIRIADDAHEPTACWGMGMVALRRFAERCAQRDHQPDEHIGCAKCVACEAEDALRANQGGAAT